MKNMGDEEISSSAFASSQMKIWPDRHLCQSNIDKRVATLQNLEKQYHIEPLSSPFVIMLL